MDVCEKKGGGVAAADKEGVEYVETPEVCTKKVCQNMSCATVHDNEGRACPRQLCDESLDTCVDPTVA